MKILLRMLLVFATLFSACHAKEDQDDDVASKWLIYFNTSGKPSKFKAYTPIVFDPDNHPNLQPLRKQNLLGYISLGEVTNQRSYFNDVQNNGLLIAPNPASPGSWYVDIRKPYWKKIILKQVIPTILDMGFKGLCLDTLNLPVYLEQINPAAYKGMTTAAIELVHSIRNAYPKILLMMKCSHCAYHILNQIAGDLTYLAGDGVITQYNPNTELYEYVPLATSQMQIDALVTAKEIYPKLTLLSLDYWDPRDPCMIKSIYRIEKQNGFIPYVTAVNLQEITPEPK